MYLLLPELTLSVSSPDAVGVNQTWLRFLCSFHIVVYFVADACLLLLYLFHFLSTKPRRLAGKNVYEMTYFVGWNVKP